MSSRKPRELVPGRQVYRLPHRMGTMANGFDATTDHGRWWEEPDEEARASACREVVKVLQGMHGVSAHHVCLSDVF